MKSFSDKTEIRKSKLFDRVTLENESKIINVDLKIRRYETL